MGSGRGDAEAFIQDDDAGATALCGSNVLYGQSTRCCVYFLVPLSRSQMRKSVDLMDEYVQRHKHDDSS